MFKMLRHAVNACRFEHNYMKVIISKHSTENKLFKIILRKNNLTLFEPKHRYITNTIPLSNRENFYIESLKCYLKDSPIYVWTEHISIPPPKKKPRKKNLFSYLWVISAFFLIKLMQLIL